MGSGEKFRPKNSESQPTDIEKARELKNLIAREKGRIMERLLTLSEEEIKKIHNLTLFADQITDQRFHRSAFVEKEEKHLHVTDEVDEMVNWLNKISDKKLRELKASGVTPEMLRDDLYAIAENFFMFAKELGNIREIKLDLVAWRQEYSNLIQELYKTTQPKTSVETAQDEQKNSSRLLDEIMHKRGDLVATIIQVFGINNKEWREYINENT